MDWLNSSIRSHIGKHWFCLFFPCLARSLTHQEQENVLLCYCAELSFLDFFIFFLFNPENRTDNLTVRRRRRPLLLKQNLHKTIKNSKATRGNAEKVMNCTTALTTLKLCVIRLYGESRRMHKATRALCIRGSGLDYLSKARWRNPQDHQRSHSCRPKLCAYFGSPAPDARPYFVWINHESSAQPWWDVYLASSQNSLNVKQQRCYLQKHNRE